MNRVILIGRATKDFELRYSPSGVAVAKGNMAVDRQTKEKESDFPNLIAFKQVAELCANNIKKGHKFGVEGRIQTGKYQNSEGKTVYTTEVLIDRIEFLEPRSESQQNSQNNSSNQSQASGSPIDISDDDLPF
jgi:single-strand DNA-binding protein